MGTPDDTEMERLGLYRISPGILGWLSELFTVPIRLLILLGALAWAFGISHQYAIILVVTPAALSFLPNLTFLLSTVLESRSHHADVLYLRNYSKPSFVSGTFAHDVGGLQLLVKGHLRPPYDTVSLFPPAKSDAERQQDARRRLRRGVHHVFTLRTRDDASWEAAVDHLLVSCRLIIVECYRVDGGFAWELQRIPEVVDANKVILVADVDDRTYADEINSLLVSEYRKKGASPEARIPIIIRETESRAAATQFKERLIATVREHAPYSDEFLQQRSKPIAIEILLKMLTMVLTFAWWVGLGGAIIALVVLAVSR